MTMWTALNDLDVLRPVAASKPAKGGALPARVQEKVRAQQDATERLIGWVQLIVVSVFGTLYAIAPKTFTDHETFQPVPYALAGYFLFTLLRLGLAHRIRLPDWFLYMSIVVDMLLLYSLIWSFHLQYEEPASFYLKAPTLLYVFIFIVLRALRFEARFVVAAGVAAALGWLALVGYAILADPRDNMITRDYVEYMTSNSVLLGAEFDKVISILVVTAILGMAIVRGRRLLERSVAESTAAEDLSRFFSPEVAQHIVHAESINIGAGEARDAAILNLDLRGFTRLARDHPPDEVMRLLADYQAEMVPVIRRHGGSIDKFLGDGIMATFGASLARESHAADAMACVDALVAAARRWEARMAAEGRPVRRVNAALTTGRILFGAVGEKDRLEYTVIGDAVNLSAKLEKHNGKLGTRALTTRQAHDLARAQGYVPAAAARRIDGATVEGVSEPLDLVVLAEDAAAAPPGGGRAAAAAAQMPSSPTA
jgi:adenylate cyclase